MTQEDIDSIVAALNAAHGPGSWEKFPDSSTQVTLYGVRTLYQGDLYGGDGKIFLCSSTTGAALPADLSDWDWALRVEGKQDIPFDVVQPTGSNRYLSLSGTPSVEGGKYPYAIVGTDGDSKWTAESGTIIIQEGASWPMPQ